MALNNLGLAKRPHRQTGFALILVLWVLSLMIIMAGSFALSMRREAGIVSNIKNQARASAVAESGLAFAGMMLLLPDKVKRWRADGSVYQVDVEDGTIRVKLQGENGKIDINKADEKLLQAILEFSPLADTKAQLKLVSAILDWRDQDDLIHIDGAEKDEYKAAGLKYRPRNKPFEAIEELQLVIGMDEATFKWLAPLVTVYSGQANVSLQEADKNVLMLLPDLDEGLVEDYLAMRLDSAKQDLPPPPFPSLPANAKPTPLAQNQQSRVITVVSEALLEDGTLASITATIQNNASANAPFQILDWQRNTANGGSLFADNLTDTPAASELIAKYYAEPEFNR